MDKAATNEGFDARIREDLVVSVARIFFDGNSDLFLILFWISLFFLVKKVPVRFTFNVPALSERKNLCGLGALK